MLETVCLSNCLILKLNSILTRSPSTEKTFLVGTLLNELGIQCCLFKYVKCSGICIYVAGCFIG